MLADSGKLQKAHSRTFQESWKKDHPWLRAKKNYEQPGNPLQSWCPACSQFLACKIDRIKAHEGSASHKSSMKAFVGQRSVIDTVKSNMAFVHQVRTYPH